MDTAVNDLVAQLTAGEISTADFAQQIQAVADAAHVREFPEGCPRTCQACVKAHGWQLVTCSTCGGSAVQRSDGTLGPHEVKVTRGRRGYSRKHFARFASECSRGVVRLG